MRRDGQAKPFSVEQRTGGRDEESKRLERLGIRIAEFIGSYIWGEWRMGFAGWYTPEPGIGKWE